MLRNAKEHDEAVEVDYNTVTEEKDDYKASDEELAPDAFGHSNDSYQLHQHYIGVYQEPFSAAIDDLATIDPDDSGARKIAMHKLLKVRRRFGTHGMLDHVRFVIGLGLLGHSLGDLGAPRQTDLVKKDGLLGSALALDVLCSDVDVDPPRLFNAWPASDNMFKPPRLAVVTFSKYTSDEASKTWVL